MNSGNFLNLLILLSLSFAIMQSLSLAGYFVAVFHLIVLLLFARRWQNTLVVLTEKEVSALMSALDGTGLEAKTLWSHFLSKADNARAK